MRVAAVQLQCSGDRAEDQARAAALIGEAVAQGATLIALPELFASLGRTAAMRAAAEPQRGPTFDWAATLAVQHNCTLLAGSIVERDGDHLYNTALLIGPQGELLAHYRKVHLFDVEVEGAASRESDTFSPGDDAVVAPLPDGTMLGLTICYDLRFPELFRIEALRGARIIAVPSAFTAATGADHWEVLVRARAIENQVGILAPAQWGTSPDGITRHGHALIVDAWGSVLAEAPPTGDMVLVADLDPTEGERVRRRLPSLANRRPGAYHWPESTSQ